MRAFHVTALAAGLLAAPVFAAPGPSPRPAAAAQQAPPEIRLKQPLRVLFVNTPLRHALRYLFRDRPGDCLVSVEVPELPVRAQVSAATLDEAVRAVLKAARAVDPELTLSRTQNRYLLFNAHPYHPEVALPDSGPPYWAQVEASGRGEDERLTADFRDMPLRDVISAAMAGSSLRYTVDPNVPNIPVNFNIRDVQRPALLRLVVRQAAVAIPGLELSQQDEVYVVSIRPGAAPAARAAPPREAGADRKITLDLRDMPLRDAIALLFKGSGLQYAIDPNVPNVPITLNIRDISLPAALRLIVRQAAIEAPGLTVSKEGEVYLIQRRVFPISSVTPAAFTPDDPARAPFTYNFYEIPLREAVRVLFEGTGLKCLVAADVPDVPITLNIREIQRVGALRLMVRQAAGRVPDLTYANEGGVYLVRRRVAAAVEAAPPPDERSGTPEQDVTWEKIPVQFASAASLAELFGGTAIPAPNGSRDAQGEFGGGPPAAADQYEAGGVGGIVPPGILVILGCPRDNSLMVRGTPSDIEALKNIIRQLDIPQRQFVLRLSAGSVTAEGRVGNNMPLTLAHSTHDRGFHFTAVPRLNGDGTIDIAVEGTLNLAGTPHPLSTHVSVAAGESVALFTVGDGLGATRVWLRASRAPVPGNTGEGGL